MYYHFEPNGLIRCKCRDCLKITAKRATRSMRAKLLTSFNGEPLMFPLLGGLITGGMNLLGGMFSSDTSAQNTQAQIQAQQAMSKDTQQFNAAEAEKNRAYQTTMSNTAYQRASQDMMQAGLNPAMMFSKGDAASSPGGAAASVSTPTAPTPQNTSKWAGLGRAAEQAMATAVQMKTMDKMSDEMANLQAENSRIKALTEQAITTTATERERTKNVEADTKNKYQDLTAKKLDRARQEWEAIKYIDLSGIPDSARKALHWLDFGGDKAGSFISSALGARKFLPRVRVREGSRTYSGDGKSFDEFHKDRIGF